MPTVLERALYVEINFLSATILWIMMRNLRRHNAVLSGEDQRMMRLLQVITATLMVDVGTRLIDGRTFTGARELNYAANAAYYVLQTLLGLYWLSYAYYVVKGKGLRKSRCFWLYTLPADYIIVCSLLSPWTGDVFRIDAQNLYGHGGWVFVLQAIVSWCYLVAGGVLFIYKARQETYRTRRRDYYMTASFVLYPLVGSALQIFWYGTSLIWPACTCALMLAFMDKQSRRITSDALTGVSNRGQLDYQLEMLIRHRDEGRYEPGKVWLLLMDIDGFKEINDTLGHKAGDIALARTAEAMNRAISRLGRGDFLARYGGDEFAVLCSRKTEADVDLLVEAIQREVAEEGRRWPVKGPILQLSIGRAVLAWDSTPESMISAADADMYRIKREHHIRRTMSQGA